MGPLEKRLLCELGQRYGSAFHLCPDRTAHRTPSSLLLPLRVDDRALWLKHYRFKAADAVLEAAYQRGARRKLVEIQGVRVPEVIGVMNCRSLLLEHLEGYSHCYSGQALDASRLQRLAVGLAALHRPHAPTVPVNLDWMVVELGGLTRAVCGDRGLRSELESRIAEAHRLFSTCRPQGVPCHGDLALHNLLWRDREVAILDPAFPEGLSSTGNRSCRSYDLARLAVNLLWFGCPPTTIHKFHHAYCQAAHTEGLPGLPLCVMYQTLLAVRDWGSRWSGSRRARQLLELHELAVAAIPGRLRSLEV